MSELPKPPKLRLPIGHSDFKTIRDRDYEYVDKTLFAAEIIDETASVILIPRPRRFGKTLNLSMLYYYFACHEDNHAKLFDGLNIMQAGEKYTEHQGQYPVLFISFKDIKTNDYDIAYDMIVRTLSNLYTKHDYLLESDALTLAEKKRFLKMVERQAENADVREALLVLSRHLQAHHHKPVLMLIDEYDRPMHSAFSNDYYPQMKDLIGSMLGGTLKGNNALWKAVITGILQVSKASIFSELNNVKVFSLMKEKYSRYFGFTDEEVKALLEKAQMTEHYNEVRKWYNGYHAGEIILYNPWSVIGYIDEGQFDLYWGNTSDNQLIADYLKSASINFKEKLETLLQGQCYETNIQEHMILDQKQLDENELWTLLLYSGYLRIDRISSSNLGPLCKLSIPNLEVSGVLRQCVNRWFRRDSFQDYRIFLESLAEGNIQRFRIYFQNYIYDTLSYFDTQGTESEQSYHMLTLGMIVGLQEHFYITSNRESGIGRYDVLLKPKDPKKLPGIVIEFKAVKKPADTNAVQAVAEDALAQIQRRDYQQVLASEGITNVVQIGIAFSGKEVEMAWFSTCKQ